MRVRKASSSNVDGHKSSEPGHGLSAQLFGLDQANGLVRVQFARLVAAIRLNQPCEGVSTAGAPEQIDAMNSSAILRAYLRSASAVSKTGFR